MEFWCSVCDLKKVDSKDKKTGSFYHFFGHVWKSHDAKDRSVTLGDQGSVYLACCPDCKDKLLKENEISEDSNLRMGD